MKNLTFRKTPPSRNYRGLSPIFSTLLLASIVIIFGAVAYFYASNVTTTATNQYVASAQQNQQSISERIGFEGVFYTPAPQNSIRVYMINCGTTDNLQVSGVLLYDSNHQVQGSAHTGIALKDMSGASITGLNAQKEGYFDVGTGVSLSPGTYTIALISKNGGTFSNQFAYTPTPSGIDTQLSTQSISLGQSPLTDTVTLSGSPTPTGTVNFQVSTDGGTTWTTFSGPKSLSSGSAVSDGYAPANVGTFYFRAVYSGDQNYISVTSPNKVLTVTGAATTTLMVGSVTINVGDSANYTATVTSSGSAGTPTGTVTFQVSSDGGATWTSYSSYVSLLNGQAAATPYRPSAAGIYQFRASYSGGGSFMASQSSVQTLTVNTGP